jgi:hypothetical protein
MVSPTTQYLAHKWVGKQFPYGAAGNCHHCLAISLDSAPTLRAFGMIRLSEPSRSAMRHIFAAITDMIFRHRGILSPVGPSIPP